MNVTVNGKSADVAPGSTLKDLLDAMNIKPELVACELNFKIVRRKNIAEQKLSEGDQIEVLQMIGGG